MIVNLIPMAGDGQRFKKEGYITPKPLIDVLGEPMIVRAIKSMPKANRNILIVRKDQFIIEDFKKMINNYFDNIEIIEINEKTEGQASTCLIAEEYIPNDSRLNIGSCDAGFIYDSKLFDKRMEFCDALIWTYRGKEIVLKNPNMYGWVKTFDNSDLVKKVSCKMPISENPINDDVVSGAFSFKKAYLFFNSIKKMIEANDRVNNEFYVDNIFNHIKNNSIGVFEVKDHFSWGTPDELKSYLQNAN